MEHFTVGDVVGLFVGGVQVDRGVVREVLADTLAGQTARIAWEKGGVLRMQLGEADVRRVK